ncbi:unnamed protein product [Strongylus vulgaris]|uniref:Uncharacterized protein n=1 Tax=Strongylus vulgaris TaxID=40348 RepID=A0A3P7JED5_STRVU|nr:unnamed protein product [Strongylus vulgaris]
MVSDVSMPLVLNTNRVEKVVQSLSALFSRILANYNVVSSRASHADCYSWKVMATTHRVDKKFAACDDVKECGRSPPSDSRSQLWSSKAAM